MKELLIALFVVVLILLAFSRISHDEPTPQRVPATTAMCDEFGSPVRPAQSAPIAQQCNQQTPNQRNTA